MARLMRFLWMPAALSLAACNAAGAGQQDGAQETPPVQSAGAAQSGLQVVPLTIASTGKTHRFNVEVARTEAQQEKGLMFRTELPDTQGMIFPYKIPRMMSFWMRNTVIPLDLIFVRADGTIESIAANAVPYSLDTIESGEPVNLVLEVRGGLAQKLGIKAGDTVTWKDSRAGQ